MSLFKNYFVEVRIFPHYGDIFDAYEDMTGEEIPGDAEAVGFPYYVRALTMTIAIHAAISKYRRDVKKELGVEPIVDRIEVRAERAP